MHPPTLWLRLRFAAFYALRHLGISIAIALLAAVVVFGLLYPAPFRTMLGIGPIFLLVLSVDVICGPLLTLLVASPRKSQRERWLDFGLIGIVQLLALVYGLHAVWLGRPVVLAYETDRLVVVTANEVETTELVHAPEAFRRLPWWGIVRVGTRSAANNEEFMQSIEWGLAGISVATQPRWWTSWEQAHARIATHAKPLADLLQRQPQSAPVLQEAIVQTGHPAAQLRYLPLTSSKAKEWIVLLDAQLNIVGSAPVDGF